MTNSGSVRGGDITQIVLYPRFSLCRQQLEGPFYHYAKFQDNSYSRVPEFMPQTLGTEKNSEIRGKIPQKFREGPTMTSFGT